MGTPERIIHLNWILMGFSLINHPVVGDPSIYGKPRMDHCGDDLRTRSAPRAAISDVPKRDVEVGGTWATSLAQ